MKKMKRSCMCLSLVLFMFLYSMVLPVSAKEAVESHRTGDLVTTSAPGTVEPMYTGVKAGAAGYIPAYYGELSCTLGSYISSGYIQATISPSNATGNVFCSVILPNGACKALGSVPAAGGSTQKVPFYTLKTGTYTFVYESTTSATLYASGSIFQ